jgi:hypothetical protein
MYVLSRVDLHQVLYECWHHRLQSVVWFVGFDATGLGHGTAGTADVSV